MENEIWKSPPNLSRYEVSNFGKLRSVATKQSLKVSLEGGYHKRCMMVQDDSTKRRNYRIHQLVATCFIPNPDAYKHINHKDGIKDNNVYTNLEWCDDLHNVTHAIDTGLRKRSWAQKLSLDNVREIRRVYEETSATYSTIATQYNVSTDSIKDCVRYNTFRDIDVHLKYTYKINTLSGSDLLSFSMAKQTGDENFFVKKS